MARTPEEKASRAEYARLRRIAEKRTNRLNQAGYAGYKAPKLSELTGNQLKLEKLRLEKWLQKEEATLKGARAAEERRAAEQEARRERRRERERARRAEKAAQAGRNYTPRPPKQTEEERRQRHNESNRRYRERERERKASLNDELKNLPDRVGQNYRNLLSGLNKWGVKVHDMNELRKWMDYIQKRKSQQKNDKYMFDLYIDEMLNASGKSGSKITADDISAVTDDFQRFAADQAEAEADYTRQRQANEYGNDQINEMWSRFASKRR